MKISVNNSLNLERKMEGDEIYNGVAITVLKTTNEEEVRFGLKKESKS